MANRIIVVGAGPAGMMAAIRAANLSQEVTLIERNSSPGKKLLLSGKGRCNITNAGDLESFFKRFSGRGEFLRDAFKKLFNQDLIKFFEDRGLKLKVERQLRVFPVTDRSASVVQVLEDELLRSKVKILYKTKLKEIVVRDNSVNGVFVNDGELIPCDKVILACGGASYSFTGSTGEALDIAKSLGHTIVALRPGLVPLEVKQDYPKFLEGLTLKNIVLSFSDGKIRIISEVGELLFTAKGISGPLIFTQSGQIADWLKDKRPVYVEIDLKPGLTQEQLNGRLLREFKASPRKGFKNILKELLPQRLIDLFIRITKIDPDKKANQVSSKERETLVKLLKGFRMDILRTAPLEEAMVTRGGVSLKDINPRTMESRKVKGLYFAGEIIDVDADTGGFNLQAAFSTGYLAGESASV